MLIKGNNNFIWGVASSAFQTEGAYLEDGKGLSIWDVFTGRKRKIRNGHHAHRATEFYYRFEEDLDIIYQLGIRHFRFSFSWPRIIPDGTGAVNQKGLGFYHRVLDACQVRGITPWVTLYHWDLPQALQEKGGWVNRDIVSWFCNYVQVCLKNFQDKANHWMVLNEPMAFTGAGYFLGIHAPGKRGLKNFIPAMHHAVLSLAEGVRVIRSYGEQHLIGSTFSCSHITPFSTKEKDIKAAHRFDALLNRLFAEPAAGLGYPVKDLPFLKRVEKIMRAGDEIRMTAPLDFIGIQNYTREVIRHAWYIPFLNGKPVPAHERKVYHTVLNWEVYPESLYAMIKKFSQYGFRQVIVTENGAAFNDTIENGKVNDDNRIHFLQHYIEQMLKAKEEGCPVSGYFVWSLTDNFEWSEGYHPRFGLVYVNFETLKRTIKNSGRWYSDFIKRV